MEAKLLSSSVVPRQEHWSVLQNVCEVQRMSEVAAKTGTLVTYVEVWSGKVINELQDSVRMEADK